MGLIPWYPERAPDCVIPWTSEFPEDLYSLGRVLGKGSFGSVFECVEKKTGHCLACKVIQKHLIRNEEDRWDLRREMQIMRKLGCHCNIASLQRVYEDPSAVYFVMERCSDGDLLSYISKRGEIPEDEAANLFRQLVTAVAFCHQHGVVHRDLKPDNVLITRQQSDPSVPADPPFPGLACLEQTASSTFASLLYLSNNSRESSIADASLEPAQTNLQVKLTDFGQAITCRREGFIRGTAGSLPYTAPELLCRQKYNEKVDVWSLGVILYTMLTGKWPFYSPKKSVMKKMICAAHIDMVSEPWVGVSAEAKDLIKRMLTVNPAGRPSCRQLLQHPWLN